MSTIVSMGFSRDQALKALRATVWAVSRLRTGGPVGKKGVRVRFHLLSTRPRATGVVRPGLRHHPLVAVVKELSRSLVLFLPRTCWKEQCFPPLQEQ